MRENPELLVKIKQILNWLQEKHAEFSDDGLLYSSVDIRESKFKIAPVDINLFPSGFNNFSCEDLSEKFHFLKKKFIPKKVGLLIENFTRNQKYLANVENLKNALKLLNMSVTLMTIHEMKVINFSLDESSIECVNLEEFDLIICNNDLSLGCPEELMKIEHKVLPSPRLGWYNRRKHVHLGIYNDLVYSMVKELNLSVDPWYLTTFLSRCDNIDFRHKNGLEELADNVNTVLQQISQKYLQEKIFDCEPHVFIKANTGTFGMGIMVARSAHDILNINKKSRHSISVLKQGMHNVDVIIQEGIQTNIKIFDAPAENILYNIGNIALNKLMRFNREKSTQSNLNSSGMEICVSNDIDLIDSILLSLTNLAVKIEKKKYEGIKENY